MDSAAVLALMTQQSARPIQTFTVGFGDPAYDEIAEARSTAEYFGADHHEHIVQPDCVRVAETLAVHYDEPFADASAIPTFHVAELARRHVTVCLTGDGGDELFAGYTPYSDALARVGAFGVGALRTALGAGARLVPVHARGKGRLSTLALGPEAWFVWRRTVFPDYLLRRIVMPDVLAAARATPEDNAVADLLADRVSKVELALPLSRTDLLSLLHRTSNVLSASYENSHVIVVASVSPKVYARVEPFLIRREPELQPA